DGEPCNTACQSYMAWSRKLMPVAGQHRNLSPDGAASQRPQKARASPATMAHEAGSRPGASARAAKQSPAKPAEPPQEKITDLRAAGKAAAAFDAPGAIAPNALPTVAVAAASFTEMTRQRVTAATAVAERMTAAAADPTRSEQKTVIAVRPIDPA